MKEDNEHKVHCALEYTPQWYTYNPNFGFKYLFSKLGDNRLHYERGTSFSTHLFTEITRQSNAVSALCNGCDLFRPVFSSY